MALDSKTHHGKIVGIVGGVASGKSAVTKFLAELGGLVLNADQMAHDVLRQPEVVDLLVKHFGTHILSTTRNQHIGDSAEVNDRSVTRELDRSIIAKQVFGETEQHKSNRLFLESVVQSRVRDRLQSEIQKWKIGGNSKSFLVLDVPLLLERGWDRFCDYVLIVDTPFAKRKENAAGRGWSVQDWMAREQSQMSVSEKQERATHVIPNESSLDNLGKQVKSWYERYLMGQ